MAAPTLRELLRDVPGARVVAPTSGIDDMSAFAITQESSAEDAETVDGEEFRVFDVPACDETGFTHFLDGSQKTWLGAFVGFIPIYLSHTSAGIVERTERDVQPPAPYDGDLEAFFPAGLTIGDRLTQLVPLQTFDGGEDATGLAVQQLALDAISERRDLREQVLGRAFSGGKLLVDGSIAKMVPDRGEPQPFLVGMVKSHQKQYFKMRSSVDAILNMRAGQRSSLFWRRSLRSTEKPVYSFYLKLHERPDQGPLFGLVRIEIPSAPEFAEQTDQIAGWILQERAPLSLPDPRYDRMLYPIRLVEQHLKARQPSDAAVRAIIGV